MTRRYHRYLMTALLGPFLVILCALSGLAWLSQSLRFIDYIVNEGVSVRDFLWLTALMMPSLLGLVLPIALFCAVLYRYHHLMNDRELLALENAGLSAFDLAKPALMLALVVALIGYAISLYLMPVSYRAFKDKQSFLRDHYASLLLQEGVFNTPMRGLTIYIRERRMGGIMEGILVHDNRVLHKPVTYMADRGQLLQTAMGPMVMLEKGNRQEVDQPRGALTLLHFDRYSINLNLFNEDSGTRWREAQERYITELFAPDPLRPDQTNKLRSNGHQRLSWPLLSLSLVMLGMAVVLPRPFNRRGQSKRMAVAAVLGGGLVIAAIASPNLAAQQPLLTPVMYLVMLVPLILAAWHLRTGQGWGAPPSHAMPEGTSV
jgi:lipopolysaccharide export system permease protein